MALKIQTNNPLNLSLPGVTQTADGIVFGSQYSEADARRIYKHASSDRFEIQTTLIKRKEYEPTESDLSSVSGFLSNTEEVKFYQAIAIQEVVDHHGDLLTKSFQLALLERYKLGRIFLFAHNGSIGIGRVFGGDVIPMDNDPTKFQTVLKFYISRKAILPSKLSAVESIDLGIYDRVSIGFKTNLYEYIPESESKLGKGYWLFDVPPDSDTSGTEAFELSLVSFGAQPGAAIKAQNVPIEKIGKLPKINKKMDLKQLSFKGVGTLKIEDTELAETLKEQFDGQAKTISDQAAKLKKFEGVDLEALKAKAEKWDTFAVDAKEKSVQELVNIRKQLFGDKVNAEKEIAKYGRFDLEEIQDEITNMKALAGDQANPIPVGGKKKKKSGIGHF